MYIIKEYFLSLPKLKELCLSAINNEVLSDYVVKKGNVTKQKKIENLDNAQKEFNANFSTSEIIRDSKISYASVFVLVEEIKGKDPVVISKSELKFADKE